MGKNTWLSLISNRLDGIEFIHDDQTIKVNLIQPRIETRNGFVITDPIESKSYIWRDIVIDNNLSMMSFR